MSEHVTIVRAAHDCTEQCAWGKEGCNKGEGGWHGIDSAGISFAVVESRQGRAAVLNILSGWYLPETVERMKSEENGRLLGALLPDGLGTIELHTSFPRQYAKEPSTKWCPYMGSNPCYTDGGSSLAAQEGYKIMVSKGSDALWAWLDDWLKEAEHDD